MRKKVTVVGAGNVGATCALRIAEKELADVVLVDVAEGVPQGKGLDLLQSGPVEGYNSSVIGANDYSLTAGSDVVVITAGLARKPGMSRDDLVRKNQEIVTQVVQSVVAHSPNTIIIMVTNPLDAMAQLAFKISGFPKQRVVGMAGVLDTARFRTFVAQELGVSVRDVAAYVLGGHGDTMVPLARFSTVAGIPLPQLLPAERIEQIIQRTRDGGAEIVNLLGTGSAFYAPSAAINQMIEAIVFDKKQIMPCSVYLQGEYGIHDLFVGVPVKLGASGVEQIVEIELTESERAQLQKSADAVRTLIKVMGL